jgi:23S rRNA (uracil1939-C5)-methyltransferase
MSDHPEHVAQGVGVPVAAGDSADLEIEGVAAGGRGVARPGGPVWLVRGGFPGDRVEAVAERVHRRHVEAGVVRLIRAGGGRREAPCPIQEDCGGCPWMPLAEPEQRRFKSVLVTEALQRIGRFPEPPVEPIEFGPEALGYRGKVELTLGRDPRGNRVVGFHRADGRGLLDVDPCLLLPAPAARVHRLVRELLLRETGLFPDRFWSCRPPQRLVLRHSRATGDVMVALLGPPVGLTGLKELGRTVLDLDPAVCGVVRVRTRGRRRGGASTERLAGRPYLVESVAGFRFRLPATTFFQVNPPAAEILVGLVRQAMEARPGDRILDLYGGVGLHGAALASEGAAVTVVEADAGAVHWGRESARERRTGERLKFVRADVGNDLVRRARERGRVDGVVANPPRTGFGRGVVNGIAALAPRRICIVSCDPPTLARDVSGLGSLGYRMERVVPVDLFPQTAHVEAVAGLVRAEDRP